MEQQEVAGKAIGIAYWEGACLVVDAEGRTVGRAYLELTGYDQPLNGRL